MTGTVANDEFYRMPSLGADMTEGRILEWLVAPGDRLERGDLVAVVETDKSDIEVEVFHPCVVDEFLVAVGDEVAVGDPIARITPVGPGRPRDEPVASAAMRRPEPETPARVHSSPRARRLARERGVPLEEIGTGGRVTGDDVLRAAGHDTPSRTVTGSSSGPAVAPSDPEVRAATMRQTIARRMERAWAEIPHYHVSETLDVTDLIERIRLRNEGLGAADRLLLAAVLNVAVARAASDVEEVNGWWRSGRFVGATDVDLGVVLSLRRGGIVVPTIAGANRLDCAEMMSTMNDLVERARRGRLRASDNADASITVTNMGDAGAATVLGVIHPPQVALVGFGGVRDEPRVVSGDVAARRVVHVSVAGDHRAHDGATASRFLRQLAQHLENLP